MFGGEFGDEAAGDARRPLAIDAAVGGVHDRGRRPRPRDRDIGEAAFLLQTGKATLVERSLRGEYAFLPPDEECLVELQPLGRVDGHDRDLGVARRRLVVHHQTDVFEEIAERFVFLHCAGEFGEVFEAAAGLDSLFGLKCQRVAAFVEHGAGQICVREVAPQISPTRDVADQIAERAARLRGQFVGVENACGGVDERDALGAGEHLYLCDRFVAQPALRHIDDAFEGEVVARLVDEAQIGERIADFGAFVKTETADDAVGHADGDEAVLELARLVLRADEDGDAVEAVGAFGSAMLPRLDLVTDAARLLGAVPHADDFDPVALWQISEQGFAKAAAVVGDDPAGGGEDVRGAAVILFEPNDFGTWKVLFKLQDIFDLRAAPAVDRLVVVANAAEVLALLGKQAEPEILAGVRILIFIDHDVAETVLIGFQHVAVRLQDHQHVEQQVAEIAGVECLEPRLIGGVEFRAAPIGEQLAVARANVGGDQSLVLPPVNEARKRARREPLFVEVGGDDELFHHAQLVVGVENGEVRLQADEFGVAAEHLGGNRVESAEPRHPLDRVTDQPTHAFPHFPRGLVSEGDAQDFAGVRFPRVNKMREPRSQRRRLAGARARQHEDRAVGGEHSFTLRRVQAAQIGGIGLSGFGQGHRRTIRERRCRGQAADHKRRSFRY